MYRECETADCANKVWRARGKKTPRFCERCEALREWLLRQKRRTAPLNDAENEQLAREERITHRVLCD